MASPVDMTPEERYALITRDLQEVLGGEAILEMLKQGKTPSLYWGTAPTGRRKARIVSQRGQNDTY